MAILAIGNANLAISTKLGQKIYITIRSLMSSVMDLIGPKRLELFAKFDADWLIFVDARV